MRRTRIVGTIGPASSDPETLAGLLAAGLNVARLNYSHGTNAGKEALVANLRAAEAAAGRPLAILADLPGPKLRLGTFEGEIMLEPGDELALCCGQPSAEIPAEWLGRSPGWAGSRTELMLPVPYAGLSADLRAGDPVLLADGLLRLEVVSAPGEPASEVHCRVIDGGPLTQRKGINVPGTVVKLPAVGQRDLELLDHAISVGVDYVAISYVRGPEELEPARELIRERGVHTPLIAKIEHPVALERLDEILDAADGVMVARGDLGVEIPIEAVPLAQERIIRGGLERGMPVILATQVLETMVTNPRPTRAEVTDIANAVRQGVSAVMLSGETAAGKHPVLVVETLAQVLAHVDEHLEIHGFEPVGSSMVATRSVAQAGVMLAKQVDADRILVATEHGNAARLVSAYHPPCPITAFTNRERAQRRTALMPGVDCVMVDDHERGRDTILEAVRKLVADGRVLAGHTLVAVSGSPLAIGGATSTVRLLKVDADGLILDME